MSKVKILGLFLAVVGAFAREENQQISQFSVVSPQCVDPSVTKLAQQSPKTTCEHNNGVQLQGRYKHSEALFGIPQYSGKLSGRVWYGTQGDRNGCMPYTESPWTDGVAMDTPAILLIDRGNCTFVQKVRNAQDTSANAVIIVDNKDEDNLPLMADDGTGNDVDIPAVFISKSSGQKIKDALAYASEVMVELSWSLSSSDNIVDWTFWTSANDDDSINFVKNFKEAYAALGTRSALTPHYLIIDGKQFQCDGPTYPCDKQCTHHGLYCAEDPEKDFNKGLDGEDIVMENLRQICIWQKVNDKTKWWDYVAKFDKECELDENFHQACSETQQRAVGLTDAEIKLVQDCVTKSDQHDGTNSLLEAELTARRRDGIFILPTVMINTQKYRGRLTCPHPIDLSSCGMLQAICAGFNDISAVWPVGSPSPCRSDYCWTKTDACGVCLNDETDPQWNKSCCDATPGKTLDACGVCGGDGSFECDGSKCRQGSDPLKGFCDEWSDLSKDQRSSLENKGYSESKYNAEMGLAVETRGGDGGGGSGSKTNVTPIVVSVILVTLVAAVLTVWYVKRKERRMKAYVENMVANYMPLQDNGNGASTGGVNFSLRSTQPGTPTNNDRGSMLQNPEVELGERTDDAYPTNDSLAI